MNIPKTKKEIATHLEIGESTLYRWLKRQKITIPRGYIQPAEVIRIYKKLGYEHKLRAFREEGVQ